MNILYYLKISDDFYFEHFERLLFSVSVEKRKKIKGFHFNVDKKLSLYSEIIVRYVICRKFNINNSKIVFTRNEYGKPYLKDYINFYFNLSHTRNAIAVAISDKPVGVDIEKVGTAELIIANRFFNESEVAYITKTEIDIDKRFYEVWTKKEAYIKYIGKGLSIPLNSFDTLDNKVSKQIQTFEKDGYIISACSEYQNQMYEIVELSESDIESKAMEFLQ